MVAQQKILKTTLVGCSTENVWCDWKWVCCSTPPLRSQDSRSRSWRRKIIRRHSAWVEEVLAWLAVARCTDWQFIRTRWAWPSSGCWRVGVVLDPPDVVWTTFHCFPDSARLCCAVILCVFRGSLATLSQQWFGTCGCFSLMHLRQSAFCSTYLRNLRCFSVERCGNAASRLVILWLLEWGALSDLLSWFCQCKNLSSESLLAPLFLSACLSFLLKPLAELLHTCKRTFLLHCFLCTSRTASSRRWPCSLVLHGCFLSCGYNAFCLVWFWVALLFRPPHITHDTFFSWIWSNLATSKHMFTMIN